MNVPRLARTFLRSKPRSTASSALFGLVTVFGLFGSAGFGVHTALAAGEDSPFGVAAAPAASGVVASAGSYNAYTGSAVRTVLDLVVPGAVGSYPLAFARTSVSRLIPGEYGGSRAFGKAASWRHSYNWGCYLETFVGGNRWRVHYPDGRVTRFSAQVQPVQPPQVYDPYMPSTDKGVGERLESISQSSDKILHCTDGGKVYFQWRASYQTYFAIWIWDPQDQKTTLDYYPSGHAFQGRLSRITEPAGRYLDVVWRTYTDAPANVSDPVIDYVVANNGQWVQYNYYPQTYAAQYICLLGVTYKSDKDANGNPYEAIYTYQDDNTGAGGRPLLLHCDDPHFQGPMARIKYNFKASASVPTGQIEAEVDDVAGNISSFNQTNNTDTRGDGVSSAYLYTGNQLTGQNDYDGKHVDYGYDSNGYLNWVRNRNGHDTSIERDPYVGNRTKVIRKDTNNVNLFTTFNYGGTSSNPYPIEPYWLMSVTDPHLQTTTYTRDARHRVTRIDYPNGTYETTAYNTFGQPIQRREINGASYTFTYDSRYLLVQSTDSFNSPNGLYVTYEYDGLDRLKHVTDAKGHHTWFDYDGRHQLTKVTHDDNTFVEYTYDKYGNRIRVRDELNRVATIDYDRYRRPKQIVVPVTAQTTRTTTINYSRDGVTNGNLHTQRGFGLVTLPSGKQIKRVYSGLGRLRRVTKGLIGTSDVVSESYEYDDEGNLLTVKDNNGTAQATYTYDVLERKKTLTDANGHVTTWNYYTTDHGTPYTGWLMSMVAPGRSQGGYATTNYTSYDLVGRLLATTDPSGNTTGKTYDSLGRLKTVSDSNGSYVYDYDVMGRVKTLTFPDQRTHTWEYDAAGNAIKFKNRKGNKRTTQYDGRDRAYRADWDDGTTSPKAWVLDAAGQLREAQGWSANVKFEYDLAGHVTKESDTNYIYGGGITNATTFREDADGNINSMTYPAGDVPNFSYDKQNRCTGLIGGWCVLDYEDEQVISRSLGNSLYTEYDYQPNGRVKQVTQLKNNGNNTATNISNRNYGYAPNGRITWCNRTSDGGASGSVLENDHGENYQYNGDGSVKAFGMLFGSTWRPADAYGDSDANVNNFVDGAGNGTYANTYTYDGAGNRSQVRQWGGNVTYGTYAGHRYYGSVYDDNGNTTNSAVGWTYAYDAEGQMIQATRLSDNYVIGYAYDALGRLIAQTGPGAPTLYCYAGSQRIEERNLYTNASIYRYFFDAPGSDRICFRQTSNGQPYQGVRLYYQYDAMGNTTHVSNDSGVVVEQYLYDAYGYPYTYNKFGTYLGNAGAQDNRYLFHGSSAYQWNPAAGLYYCRARMYLPQHGRFLQPDPIGLAGGDLNLYRYCGNDPINLVDPDGCKYEVVGDINRFNQAIDYLSGSPTFNRVWQNIVNSPRTVTFNANPNKFVHNADGEEIENNQYISGDKTVYWNPVSAVQVGKNGGYMSPALVLAHEAGHVNTSIWSGIWHSFLYFIKVPQYDNLEEVRVGKTVETPIANELGESTRNDHRGGDTIIVLDPSLNTDQVHDENRRQQDPRQPPSHLESWLNDPYSNSSVYFPGDSYNGYGINIRWLPGVGSMFPGFDPWNTFPTEGVKIQ